MKKAAALVIAIAVMLATAPVFAQGAAAPAKERNLFKIIENSMKGPHQVKPRNQLRGVGKINLFQMNFFLKKRIWANYPVLLLKL